MGSTPEVFDFATKRGTPLKVRERKTIWRKKGFLQILRKECCFTNFAIESKLVQMKACLKNGPKSHTVKHFAHGNPRLVKFPMKSGIFLKGLKFCLDIKLGVAQGGYSPPTNAYPGPKTRLWLSK